MNRIRIWGRMLFYENGELSLTRVIIGLGFLAFLIVSAYLVYTKTTWQNYDTFAAVTGAGSPGTQLINKFINSKYNSAPGTYRQAGTKGGSV